MLSGPLEMATAYIGFAQYLSFLWPGMTPVQSHLLMATMGLVTIFLLYRLTGAMHFDPQVAFDFPPGAPDRRHANW